MSKILVLGRTMDMGGTEVAMAALLQKLVEKKDLGQKAASGFGTDCGKTGDTGRTVFLCQRNGRISDARRVWKETVWKTV